MSDKNDGAADWVRWYQSMGWSVTPLFAPTSYAPTPEAATCSCHRGAACAAPGKHPLHSRWSQDVRVWTDLDLSPTVGAFRDRNIGLLTGSVSGLLVVDLDNDDGKEGSATARRLVDKGKLELPTTLSQRTGSGYQLVYSLPSEARFAGQRTKGTVGVFDSLGLTGFDLRGEGNQVVVPPSIHYTGRNYEWLNPNTPVATAPDSLMRYALNGKVEANGTFAPATADAASLFVRAVTKGVGKGARYASLYPLIAPVAAAWGHAEVEGPAHAEAVWQFARWLNTTKFRPPLDDDDVERAVRAALANNKVGYASAAAWLVANGADPAKLKEYKA